jgi:hypothetical protein
MSFQWIVDRAEKISKNNKKMIGQTETRSGVVRSVSRGSQPVRLTVTLPDGIPWTEISTDIANAVTLDRYQTANVAIPYSRFPWYYNNLQPVQNERYLVLCVEFPEWTLFAQNQVSWSGPFVFQEYLA